MRVTTSCNGKLHDAQITDESLSPCPFCGSFALKLRHTWTAAYWVECSTCSARRMGDGDNNSDPYAADAHIRNAGSAVRGWNVRATPPPAYVCPRCGVASYHPKDRQERYCARCRRFEDDAESDAGRHRLCVLLELSSDDPALDPEAIDVSTADAAGRVRSAVIAALGGDSRVVAVLPLETAQMMMEAYDAVSAANGAPPDRPPANYVPPPDRDLT